MAAAAGECPVTGYASDVVAGRTVAGKLVRLACERHLRDLKAGHKRGLRFDQAAAEHAIQFFSFLQHSKGEWAGTVFHLSLWQQFIVGSVFGWMRADKTRRFRTAYVEVPRKNGKSTLAAGIGLYLFVADGEPGAEVYSSATKRDQAKIVWSEAQRMVKASPALKARVRSFRNNLSIDGTASKFEPLGADSDTLDGLNAHGNIVDELHAHRDRGLWDVLDTSMGSRRQPLTAAITTAGTYNPESIGWEQHDYAIKVLQGALEDDSVFAYIATCDDGDDWRSPEAWAKANPNFGVSVKLSYLEEKARKAEAVPSFTNTFQRLHLDIWPQQLKRWLQMERWNAREPQVGRIDEDKLRGRRCWAALDLSSKIDLTALMLAFPADDGSWDLVGRFWCPEDTIAARTKKDHVPYDAWVRDGYMLATPGNVVDYDFIEAEVQELAGRYQIEELAFDPWNAMQTAVRLGEKGLQMVEMRQGFASLSEPAKELERLVTAGKLRHGGHPVLRWMASNVTATSDPAGNIKPDKARSPEKIDGIVAAVMAIGRGILGGGGAPSPSVYESRGIITVG